MLRKIFILFVGILVVLTLIVIVAGVIPNGADPVLAEEAYHAGSRSVQPSYTGLQRAFPASNEPADNPTTPDKAALGRLLFFDPVLSQNNDTACATCHQPDLGFSNGQAQTIGPTGVTLPRHVPSLWGVAYNKSFFWDGRSPTLEAQVEGPLTNPDEMGVRQTAELVAELRAIPEYVTLFDKAFGGGEASITLPNIDRALSAFERTLLTNNSPFDRYAAGDVYALTPQQRRGLTLFRSGATRCFECHTAPTFTSDSFHAIGVESDDLGRAAIAGDGAPGGFKVPSLRNVALSAPYMHNGSFATLEEVVDFYAKGGGRARGVEGIDPFINGFDLTEQERANLVAFMFALTDESQLPAIPTAVPSGLPVITHQENPARAVAAAMNVGTPSGDEPDARAPMTIVVQDGESIQTAVDRAQPGDTVQIPYGTYHERVVIDLNHITLEGIPNAAGDFPILDGEGKLSEGVISSGNDFTVGNLHVMNYTDNGVLVEGVSNVHFHDIFAENVGTYGIYPVQSSHVLIERMEVTGVNDAGIYAGQCEDVTVRDSVTYGNVLGIELENTVGGEIANNHTYDNSIGIFVVLLPQLTSKASMNTLVHDNLTEANNHENFAPEGAMARIAPPGIGMLILGSDHNEVYNNTIKGNNTAGIVLLSLTGTGKFDVNELDIGPLPEDNWIHDNVYLDNGHSPAPEAVEAGFPAADLLWDGSGNNNRFNEQGITTFPPILPSNEWPSFLQKSTTNIWHWLVSLVG